nr:unnamed protein product [Callosobruchus chinensis]
MFKFIQCFVCQSSLLKAQIGPSLEYFSHIWETGAPNTLSILEAVQRREIQLIGVPALTCHLQPLSHRRVVGDLSIFYRYYNGVCTSELTSYDSGLHLTPRRWFAHQEPSGTRAPLLPGPGMDCLVSLGTLVFRPCLRGMLSYKKT